MNSAIKIGQKYYRDNDGLEIIRVVQKNKDGNITILINERNRRKVSVDHLDQFTKLNSDGILVFNIVQLGQEEKSKDIIAMLYRRKDIRNKEKEPFCACRQCIYDTYSSINKDEITYMGLSLTKENCPENVPFSSLLACNKLIHFEEIAVYNDDNLNTLLSLLQKKKEFDTILKDLHLANARVDNKVEGFSRSLKNLLEDNYFMYDYRSSFGIDTVEFVVKYDDETYELDLSGVEALQQKYKVQMIRTMVVPYDKTIDLEKIERSHLLIADKHDKIYIIAYDKGEYMNDYLRNNVSDKSNIVRMIKHAMKK